MSGIENRAEGEVSKLSGQEGQQNTTNPSDSNIHQEGIDHIKANTDAGASNPGTDDSMPSGTGVGQGQTPGSYPGTDDSMSSGMVSGGQAPAGHPSTDDSMPSGSGGVGATTSSEPAGGDASKVTQDDPTDIASKGSSSQKYENTSGDTETTDENRKGSGAGKQPSGIKENPSAIPTAGGEKLGAAHAGESKMVPDVPKSQEEEKQEAQKVSSSEGQPDSQTKDNTSANTGGDAPSSSGDGSGEGKQSFTEKIKDKLNMG